MVGRGYWSRSIHQVGDKMEALKQGLRLARPFRDGLRPVLHHAEKAIRVFISQSCQKRASHTGAGASAAGKLRMLQLVCLFHTRRHPAGFDASIREREAPCL